jgi:hypothetical protein
MDYMSPELIFSLLGVAGHYQPQEARQANNYFT